MLDHALLPVYLRIPVCTTQLKVFNQQASFGNSASPRGSSHNNPSEQASEIKREELCAGRRASIILILQASSSYIKSLV